MPFAMATSRYWRLKNWDRTTINLPFSRGALVGGEIIMVPPDATPEAMEALRVRLEATLNDGHGAPLCANRPSRRGPLMANALPMTLRLYRRLSTVAVPLAPALIKRRLKQGKGDPAGVGGRRGMGAGVRAGGEQFRYVGVLGPGDRGGDGRQPFPRRYHPSIRALRFAALRRAIPRSL